MTPIFSNPLLVGDLIGYTAGLAIAACLLFLVLRARRLPGSGRAGIALAVCAVIWNLGGLTHAVIHIMYGPEICRPALFALAFQFTGAAAFSIPMLVIWSRFAINRRQTQGARILIGLTSISALVITLFLWTGAASGDLAFSMKRYTSYCASLFLVSGAILLLRGQMNSRTIRVSALLILAAVLAGSAAVAVAENANVSPMASAALFTFASQAVLLAVIGAFFLFARFRYADIAIRYCVRIALAAGFALALVAIPHTNLVEQMVTRSAIPQAAELFASGLTAAFLLIAFRWLDKRLATAVNRTIFHTKGLRAAAGIIGDRMPFINSEKELAHAIELSARDTLQLHDSRLLLLSSDSVNPLRASLAAGEIVELLPCHGAQKDLPFPCDLLLPVNSAGKTTHVLAIATGWSRPGLVTQEITFLRSLAAHCGSRLDALRIEHDRVDRLSREAVLQRQVTEAELRALRAQINPHFLFNSLNTIADLIVTDPPRAELMTLRLARVFRHLLTHSTRPQTSIREEVEFLRTYLDIEEARFGSRLSVNIDIAGDVAHESIPALILQPLVENAIKHGLSPKPGGGRLWITAAALDGHIQLTVEDDGVGTSHSLESKNGNGGGIGLSNVADRLRTLYQGQAGVRLEPRPSGGSRAVLWLPRSQPCMTS